MGNVLKNAVSWLDAQCEKHLSETVTYRRGAQSFEVLATIGETSFELTGDDGAVVRQQVRDYLVRAADLQLGLPERGDQIVEQVGDVQVVCEVLPIGDEPCWRYSDPYRVRVRIHTKQVQGETS